MSNKQPMVYTAGGVTFVWGGGPYVDQYWADAWTLRGEDATAFSAINVWDYATGKATIATQDELATACDEWLEENTEDLGKYLENSL